MAGSRKSAQSVRPRTRRTSLGRKKANGAGIDLRLQLAESRAQQAATTAILRIINRSPSDVQAVFDAIVKHARRLLRGYGSLLTRVDGEMLHLAARAAPAADLATYSGFYPRPIKDAFTHGRAILTRRPVVVEDTKKVPRSVRSPGIRRARGFRSLVAVPLLLRGTAIGALAVSRPEPGRFDASQIRLLEAFAGQAVIAIENARSFNETKEALERQTATAEILKVIASSPADIQPVLHAVAVRAAKLIDAPSVSVVLRDGDVARVGSVFTDTPGHAPPLGHVIPVRREYMIGRTILERRTLHIEDVVPLLKSRFHGARKNQRDFGFRTVLVVPLLRGKTAIGVIYAWRRVVRKFAKEEVALLETFADQAVIAIENARSFNETREALERQTATAEILKVIAKSPSDVQPVFDAIAKCAMQLIGGHSALVTRLVDDALHLAALTTTSKSGDKALRAVYPAPLSRGRQVGVQAALAGKPVFIADIETEYAGELRRMARARGYRSALAVPMLRDGLVIGTIHVTRHEPGIFTDQQIALLQTFADQAVIAIENVRLFNETREALERQTATAEILKVIASSPSDIQPVFDAIVASAQRLIPGKATHLLLRRESQFVLAAYAGAAMRESTDEVRAAPLDREKNFPSRAILDGEVVHVTDWERDDIPEFEKLVGKVYGVRSGVLVPLLRGGEGIGAIAVTREVAGPYHEKQISLLRAFADQAVIAIENVRLFNETKESLERQTATSEVLKTISRSTFDLNAVLQVLIENATRLAGAAQGFIFRVEGGSARLAYSFNAPPEYRALMEATRFSPGRGGLVSRVLLERRTVHLPDALADAEFTLHEAQRLGGFRSMLGVPMLREGNLIGVIAMWSTEVRPFTEKQMELVSTFADQAVIAIENVRLFNETKESLERQTATAEILKVIASSPTDVQPVFDVIVESAVRLCGARFGRVYRYDGSNIQMVAGHGLSTSGLATVNRVFPRPAADDTIVGRVILARQPLFIRDIERDETVPELSRQMMKALDTRSQVTVPMLRAGESIGAMTMGWDATDGFDDQQVALLQTFADQAVIAIENVRLFNETKEALERQTATAEILKVIASSPSDVAPVFEAIVNSSLRLMRGATAHVTRLQDGKLHLVSHSKTDERGAEALRRMYPMAVEGTRMALALANRTALTLSESDPTLPEAIRAAMQARGVRVAITMPMVLRDESIGVIVVNRAKPDPFSDHEVDLLKTFADQAVIAIENVRLFNETKEALERQTATSEILQVIASSPSDVQPVFDAVARSAKNLLGGHTALIRLLEGDMLRLAATTSTEADAAQRRRLATSRNEPNSINAQAVNTGRPAVRLDSQDERSVPADIRDVARAQGYRSNLAVPMLREGVPIGTINVTRREAGPFADQQIGLLQTFAAQSVIAIENVRLFNETKESLERQTATAEILKVIASSPSDVQPVFDAILESATALCDGHFGILGLYEGEDYKYVAHRGSNEKFAKWVVENGRYKPRPGGGIARMTAERQPIHIADVREAKAYHDGNPVTVALADIGGVRTYLSVPMLKDGRVIGGITIYRPEVRPFTDKQIDLVSTFASQAVIAIENSRLFNETKEALERQTATAEILKVIASSPSDVQPVFDAIAHAAKRLVSGFSVAVLRLVDGTLHLAALTSTNPVGDDAVRRTFPRPVHAMGILAIDAAIRTRMPQAHADLQNDPNVEEERKAAARARGFRGSLAVPMLLGGETVGIINVTRSEAGYFADHQIELLKTFADQAVIAIENVRLFNETKEALEKQTATSDILRSISQAQTDAQPVFEAIVRNAVRLCGASYGGVYQFDGELIHVAANDGYTPEELHMWRSTFPRNIRQGGMIGRAIRIAEPVVVRDYVVEDWPELSPEGRASLLARGARSGLHVPMFRVDKVIGAISLVHKEPAAFTDTHVELLRTFADQAVIAIENVRLFNETKEALERQTATSEILQVIGSSPTDTQPVFDAIVNSGVRLFPGAMISVARPEGGMVRAAAIAHEDATMVAGWKERFATPLSRDRLHAAAILDAKLIDFPDVEAEKDGPLGPGVRNFLKSGNRAVTIMPMLRGEGAIGAISVVRAAPGPLTDKQIAILKTFADQAVIAIENVRLFNETKESLERQTATAEILKVIASSPSDVQPVFDAIARSAVRLIGGFSSSVRQIIGDMLHLASYTSTDPAGDETLRNSYPRPITDVSDTVRKVLATGKPHSMIDSETEPSTATQRKVWSARGYRSSLTVPMLREGDIVGVITVTRREPGAFSSHQFELLMTFANQAVIAIENVRLFKELQTRTEALTKSVGQLTALGEVGQALSSTLEIDKVLQTVVTRAVQLTNLDGGAIYEYDPAAEIYTLKAYEKFPEEFVETVRREPIRKGDGVTGRTAVTLEPVQMADILDDKYHGSRREILERAGYRAILAVPLLREENLVGALMVMRKSPGEFAPEVVELLKTFAAQSAMAIQNARLFREIAEKGQQLEIASRHKSDFLANMSHELRTPLNAIIGFSEVLIERMFGELNEKQADYMKDIHESGRHLLSLINDILDLSKIEAGRMDLDMAAFDLPSSLANAMTLVRERAQRNGIALGLEVDPALGEFRADERKVKQILLNLLSNAVKFTPEGGRVDVTAALRGGVVSIAVKDTGVGIAPEDQAAVFEEFKQVGSDYTRKAEGTGLGLALTKRFVELHGGEIRLESQPGKGSTFTFTLPVRP